MKLWLCWKFCLYGFILHIRMFQSWIAKNLHFWKIYINYCKWLPAHGEIFPNLTTTSLVENFYILVITYVYEHDIYGMRVVEFTLISGCVMMLLIKWNWYSFLIVCTIMCFMVWSWALKLCVYSCKCSVNDKCRSRMNVIQVSENVIPRKWLRWN